MSPAAFIKRCARDVLFQGSSLTPRYQIDTILPTSPAASNLFIFFRTHSQTKQGGRLARQMNFPSAGNALEELGGCSEQQTIASRRLIDL
jgi:hypothetical protein